MAVIKQYKGKGRYSKIEGINVLENGKIKVIVGIYDSKEASVNINNRLAVEKLESGVVISNEMKAQIYKNLMANDPSLVAVLDEGQPCDICVAESCVDCEHACQECLNPLNSCVCEEVPVE